MSAWSQLVAEALPAPGRAPGPVERWSVRPGEVGARVAGHEVSLARPVAEEEDWDRVCAALASQPVFRAPALDGRLPVELARVFAVVGLPLVPSGWGPLAASCTCAHWDGVCAHLGAVVAELAARADADPFVLVRWAGGEKAAFVARVSAAAAHRGEVEPGDPQDGDPDPASAAVFWSAPVLPELPEGLPGTGPRVRAAAPGSLWDDLPVFDRPE
ncbi:hypothetical protein IDM40_02105 [Nocardiopsis sp. HNM0947]|uniref:SWIM-type domain-containing protein n=1 Tax=Nocardiopsis coralli TaxID=2772213 RepID=A0ABR9P0Y5_9ACTN|nr:hypothetical protein [Nocardiopsis coralli]MBE2997499.1 hypothetical protein [Nocardiopsis coralli]